jgi:hypothetical protein
VSPGQSMKRHFFFALASISLLACGEEDSADLATGDIQATFSAEHIDGSLHIAAFFDTGDGFERSDVKLSAGDTLSASTDKGALPAFRENSIDDAILSLDADGDFDEVTISLTRASQTSAPASVATLPAHFDLTAPTGDVSYADGAVTFEWANPEAGAHIAYFKRACGAVSVGITNDIGDDQGSLSIPVTSLLDEAPGPGGECVTVTLVRVGHGAVDPAFHAESVFNTRRDDEFDITIVP